MVSMMGLQASAQTLIWKNFSSMYNVNGITIFNGHVWAATSGGVFSYSPVSGTFDEFTTTEGLSNIQATSIISDSGNILVGEGDGTIDELNSSGVRYRSQKDIEKSSALSKRVRNLAVAGDTLFACTDFGVIVISRSSFGILDSYLHFFPKQATDTANSVAIFHGDIYVASPFGLSFAPRSATDLAAPDFWNAVPDSIGFSSGVSSLVVFNGSLLVGTNHGIFYSSDGITFQLLPGTGTMNVVTLVDDGNSLLINSQNGLFKLLPDNSISTIYSGGVSLHNVAAYADTLILGGTSLGLLSIGSSVQTIVPPGPATNFVNHLSVDASGNLWCATSSDDHGWAFMKFDGTKWKNYSLSQTPILTTNQFFQISAVCGNRIVAGAWGGPGPKPTPRGGIALLSSDTITKVFNSSNSQLVGISNDPTYVVVGDAACDANGNIWMTDFGAYNGNILAVYSPQDSSWYTFNNPYSPPAGFVSIAVDGYGGVWAGDQFVDNQGNFDGVFYYNANGTLDDKSDDQSFPIGTSDGLLSDQVNSVMVDNENQVWVGTTLGLNVIYDPTDPSLVLSIYSMLDQDILGIDYDALDNKWISTVTGVFVLSKDGNTQLAQYNITNSPIPNDNVVSVACDRIHGIVYFATNYGVTQLKMGVIQPQTNFTKIKVYPNPVKFPIKDYVRIAGLVADSQIKIFSVAGKMVSHLPGPAGTVQGDIAYWFGTDDEGRLLPSGIYIIIAYSPDGTQSAVTKVAIVR